jgi:uncharacterized protein
MKKLFTFFAFIISATLSAQDIAGTWHSLLKFPGGQLRIDINVTNTGNGYSVTFDSPDQGAKGIPTEQVSFKDNVLTWAIPQAGIRYTGKFENNFIKGTFTQGEGSLPLDFSREAVRVVVKKKPQEPVAPFPYKSEDVKFNNAAAPGVTLAGTLTMPSTPGPHPAVILITGSGAQNRDEEILGHKPFMILADYLTRNGIAVLRYDDRGIADSTGDFAKATTADFATDAQAAFTYLKTRKDINGKKIGFAGHSEGGSVAAIAAAANPDIAYIVLIAGSILPGDQQMLLQNFMMGKSAGMPETELTKLGAMNRKVYDVIKQETDLAVMKTKITAVMNTELKPELLKQGITEPDIAQCIEVQSREMASPWYAAFIKGNPGSALEKVKCPVLAINGSTDLQVEPKANLAAVEKAAAKAGNKNVRVIELPGLNHLMQESKTGKPAEYGDIEQTFSPKALEVIGTWIKETVK